MKSKIIKEIKFREDGEIMCMTVEPVGTVKKMKQFQKELEEVI